MKKGFTLVELLVSIAILSIAMVFISVFVLNLKDDRGKVLLNVPVLIDQAAISKKLNYDAEVMGIKSITPYGNKEYRIEYLTNEARIIRISDDNKTLTYDDGNSNIYLVKTLNNNAFGKTVNGNTTYFDTTSSAMSGGSIYTKLTIYLADDDNINLYNYNDGKSRVRVILDVNGGKAWTSSTCPAINGYNFEEVTSECSKTFASGSEIGSLLNPSRAGYTFISWYDARGALVKPNKVLTENETLYAQWNPNNYQVSFDKRGGTGGIDGTTATYDKVLSLSSEDLPTMVGKDFAGYYTASSGGKSIITGSGEGSVWKFEESKTLYAQWSTKTINCQPGKYLPKNSESCSNCPGGSFCADNPSTCQYSTSDDCGITGECNPGTYSQTGASACTPCAAGTSQSQSGKTSCTACSKGKFQSATGQTSCSNCPIGSYQDETGQQECKVCAAGKTSSIGAQGQCTSNCSNNAHVASWETPSWNANTGSVNNVCTVKTCETNYHKYNNTCAADTYTITYYDGSQVVHPTGAPKSYAYGVGATINATPTKSGYTFNGWSTSSTISTSNTSFSQTIGTNVTGNKTFYEAWCQNCSSVSNGTCSLNAATAGACTYTTTCNSGYMPTSGEGTPNPVCTRKYTLSFDCNGGSVNENPTPVDIPEGQSYNLPTDNYNCGYNIIAGDSSDQNVNPAVNYQIGWSTSNSATSGQTSITPSGDITVYAVWKKLFTYAGDYTIINDGNGNWRAKFKTSGNKTLTMNKSTDIDIFAVGGGGGGGAGNPGNSNTLYAGGGGGGGGYVKTCSDLSVSGSITITVGAGGTAETKSNGGRGGSSSFGTLCTAEGGYGGHYGGYDRYRTGGAGGDGGSGGGGGGQNGGDVQLKSGNGGRNGNAATCNGSCVKTENNQAGNPGNGSDTTTCEFGEGSKGAANCNTGYTLFSGGGSGGGGSRSTGVLCAKSVGTPGSGGGGKGGCLYVSNACNSNSQYGTGTAGTANTGGGGGGGASSIISGTFYAGGAGGSGIVIIRNAR